MRTSNINDLLKFKNGVFDENTLAFTILLKINDVFTLAFFKNLRNYSKNFTKPRVYFIAVLILINRLFLLINTSILFIFIDFKTPHRVQFELIQSSIIFHDQMIIEILGDFNFSHRTHPTQNICAYLHIQIIFSDGTPNNSTSGFSC